MCGLSIDQVLMYRSPTALRKSLSVKEKNIAVFFKSTRLVQHIVLDIRNIITAKKHTEQHLPNVIRTSDYALFSHVKIKMK